MRQSLCYTERQAKQKQFFFGTLPVIRCRHFLHREETDMNQFGMIGTAAVSPVLKVGDPSFNAQEIIRCVKLCESQGTGLIVFPELCLTGATCADLFYQESLYRAQLNALSEILAATAAMDCVIVCGMYFRLENRFFDCAAVLQRGQVMGLVPKMFPDPEIGGTRWFAPGSVTIGSWGTVTLFGAEVPFGNLLFVDADSDFALGIEIGSDFSAPISAGAQSCLAGAHIICNPAASPALMGEESRRRESVLHASKKNLCAYVLASAGPHESTGQAVYTGQSLVAESGDLLAENESLCFKNSIAVSEIDCERLRYERTKAGGFQECASAYSHPEYYMTVALAPLRFKNDFSAMLRQYSKTPYLPEDPAAREEFCRTAFRIQSTALAGRLSHTGSSRIVLGVSGGLDSTLSLLVSAEAMKLLGKPASDILTVTMPGFGTTDATYTNALAMMKAIGAEIREIPIRDSVLQHFRDIGHDPSIHDSAYENAQARERTQILMDLANKENGLHLGTGDLSEEALGWCTYNGDHMSMYNVNGGVQKTLIRSLLKWFIETKLTDGRKTAPFCADDNALARTLQSVLDTPVSPEHLPPDENGEIRQKTEEALGPYILHDFFLYHALMTGMPPAKLLAAACTAFRGDYEESFIKYCLARFYKRFFAQQFKRNCAPDGPKVAELILAPAAHIMPSDADGSAWLSEL